MVGQVERTIALATNRRLGPFKCYVTQTGVGGGCPIFRKKHYEGVMFNVISVTRGWVGAQFAEK